MRPPDYEKTFVLIKPDAIQRGAIGKIITRIEDKGLQIMAMKVVLPTRKQAEQQYACHKEKPFFDSLVSFITSGPCVAMVLQGKNAIEITRKIMGATNPLKAQPGTIRGDFSVDLKHNLIHGSDSQQSYEQEVGVYFTTQEILQYNLQLENWLYYQES